MVRIPEEHRDDSQTYEFVSVGHVLSRRFELVREIARGGMGVVFEAVDKVLDGHRVALKLLPAELSSNKAARTRLKREALAAIDLTHRNITRLHSYEEDGSHAFLVMELLSGETLEDAVVERGPLEVDEVLAVARSSVAALIQAHEKGVIHRDIKPANLMYSTAEDDRVLKVMDFGIAFRVRESMTRLTGLVHGGTLLYCPPEQLRNERADARSDQYSLAATLYELLSGDPPLTPPGIEHKILNVEPHPLETVPEHVDRALRTALAKDPDDRFEDVTAFLKALEGETKVPEPSQLHLKRGDVEDLKDEGSAITAPRSGTRGSSGVPWVVAGLSLALAVASLSGLIGPAPTGSPTPTPSPSDPPTPTPTVSASPTPTRQAELVWPRIESAPAKPGPEFETAAGGKMLWVSPGSFRMGSEDVPEAYANQKPARNVEVRTGFWLGKYEVTQAEFERLMGYNPSTFEGANRPVETLIWNDARRFCRLLTELERSQKRLPAGWEYRLPTEAQWEYACRAGTTGLRYHEDLDAIAWYEKNSDKQTQFVGKKLPNAWGFHDMIGNVWEYTLDRWHDDLEGAPADERPWDEGGTHLRAIRGSSWQYNERSTEAASRGRPFSAFNLANAGFRVALVPVELPTVPREVTVRIRSTPPGARVLRPGFEGTLGNVGTLTQPFRLSLRPGPHDFEFKVFNRKRRTIQLQVEERDLDEEVGFWAILDPDPEAEGGREELLKAELALARAETALEKARVDRAEAQVKLTEGRQAERTGGITKLELRNLEQAMDQAESGMMRAGNLYEVAEQDLARARRGDQNRVMVSFRSTPHGVLLNLDRWGEEERVSHSWHKPRLPLKPGVYTFRFRRGKKADEPLYLARTVEVEVKGSKEIKVHVDLEAEPVSPAGARAGEVRHNSMGMRLVWAPERGPVRGFWIGAHEVTRSEFQRVMGEVVDVSAPFRRPMRTVTREEAIDFCRRLTEAEREEGRLDPAWAYRLPEEEEWEYAGTEGAAGLVKEQLDALAWHKGNSRGAVHQVGTLQAGGWGIHDMLGNVAEWCADGDGLVRGGSYASTPDEILSGGRRELAGSEADEEVGFRVVVSPVAP